MPGTTGERQRCKQNDYLNLNENGLYFLCARESNVKCFGTAVMCAGSNKTISPSMFTTRCREAWRGKGNTII